MKRFFIDFLADGTKLPKDKPQNAERKHNF